MLCMQDFRAVAEKHMDDHAVPGFLSVFASVGPVHLAREVP